MIPSPNYARLDRVLVPLARALGRYNRVEYRGIENIPAEGPVLFVSTHSLVSYDMVLGMLELYARTGRLVRGLGDKSLWYVPQVAEFFESFGVVPASPGIARVVLERGELLGVCPGGMWEALRPSSERHQLRWGERQGFARLALVTGAPVVLSTCPGADMAVTIYDNPLTELVYRRFRLPLPLFRGLGPTLLPRPTKFRTYVAPPIEPPAIAGLEPSDEEVEAFRARVHARMQEWVRASMIEDGYSPP